VDGWWDDEAHHDRPGRQGAYVTEKGLREIVAAQTSVSDIDGAAGRLWYAG
jgi:citrate synthase